MDSSHGTRPRRSQSVRRRTIDDTLSGHGGRIGEAVENKADYPRAGSNERHRHHSHSCSKHHRSLQRHQSHTRCSLSQNCDQSNGRSRIEESVSLTRGQGARNATDDHQSSSCNSEDIKYTRKSSIHNHVDGRNHHQAESLEREESGEKTSRKISRGAWKKTSAPTLLEEEFPNLTLMEDANTSSKLSRRHSMLSQSSVKRLFKWKQRSGPEASSRRVSDSQEITGSMFSFSTSDEDASLMDSGSEPSPRSGSEPYNTTMQCYCGQNSCNLCNLLLNLELTNTGVN